MKGGVNWPAQKLLDYSAEFEAIGTRRNTDVTQERCESWRKWSAEAMENGAKRAYRYAKEGAPDPIAGVRDLDGVWQCSPSKIAKIFAEGWKEIWTSPGKIPWTDSVRFQSTK